MPGMATKYEINFQVFIVAKEREKKREGKKWNLTEQLKLECWKITCPVLTEDSTGTLFSYKQTW